jgi:hypothetical protein
MIASLPKLLFEHNVAQLAEFRWKPRLDYSSSALLVYSPGVPGHRGCAPLSPDVGSESPLRGSVAMRLLKRASGQQTAPHTDFLHDE